MTAMLFLTIYSAVLLAELLGDKTLYTLGSLSTRYRVSSLAVGAGIAFMAKMAVAVLSGSALHQLPHWILRWLGAATFFSVAIALWRKGPLERVPAEPTTSARSRPILVGFGAIFLTEWCDPGQLTAAAMAARYGSSFTVWGAATLAMVTKGTAGLLLGIGLRRWTPRSIVRPLGVGVSGVLGCLSLFGVEL